MLSVPRTRGVFRVIRPLLIERFLARDFLVTQAAVTAVLLLVIIGGVLGRVLRDVAEGRIPLDVLPALVAFGSFKGLMLLWPVALFLAFLLVLGRMQRDSELIAMQAGGVSFARIYRAIYMVAIPAALVLLFLMSFVVPRVEAMVDQLRDRADQRSDLVGITPGRFLRSRVGDQVFFAESLTPDRQALLSVFIYHERADGIAEVTVAKRAIAELHASARYLVLEDGHRYVGVPGEGSFQMLEFDRLRMRVPDPTLAEPRRSLDGVPMAELWEQRHQPVFRGELEWRLAMPVSVLMLALVALPLGLVPPRSGRYAAVPLAIVVYALYANLLIMGKSWVIVGQVPMWLGLWWVHLLPLSVWLVLSWRRCLWPVRFRPVRSAAR
ncbi:permease [Thioalkalivibrio paradoxus ARh 1]|uniref:Lipopolysaccharide export system permease protein LptF n=1 Tax=Thioalkalivibrio paradoxus ARh 1 TaxID=713585 RepID=W0DKW8_9GAMM|nr:permease [Thioalkalivibrio paradoxus ARh 1]